MFVKKYMFISLTHVVLMALIQSTRLIRSIPSSRMSLQDGSLFSSTE